MQYLRHQKRVTNGDVPRSARRVGACESHAEAPLWSASVQSCKCLPGQSWAMKTQSRYSGHDQAISDKIRFSTTVPFEQLRSWNV